MLPCLPWRFTWSIGFSSEKHTVLVTSELKPFQGWQPLPWHCNLPCVSLSHTHKQQQAEMNAAGPGLFNALLPRRWQSPKCDCNSQNHRITEWSITLKLDPGPYTKYQQNTYVLSTHPSNICHLKHRHVQIRAQQFYLVRPEATASRVMWNLFLSYPGKTRNAVFVPTGKNETGKYLFGFMHARLLTSSVRHMR